MSQGKTWTSPECGHRKKITIRSAGTERIVCEKCGLLSFRFVSESEADIADQDQFVQGYGQSVSA